MSDKLEIKDSGTARVFSSGAQRDATDGKGAFDQVPWVALQLVSVIYQRGNLKRGHRNWEKGMPVSGYLDCTIRHIAKYIAGMRDEPHLLQAAWNLLNAIQTCVWVHLGLRPKELYDVPNHFGTEQPPVLGDYELEILRKVWSVK